MILDGGDLGDLEGTAAPAEEDFFNETKWNNSPKADPKVLSLALQRTPSPFSLATAPVLDVGTGNGSSNSQSGSPVPSLHSAETKSLGPRDSSDSSSIPVLSPTLGDTAMDTAAAPTVSTTAGSCASRKPMLSTSSVVASKKKAGKLGVKKMTGLSFEEAEAKAKEEAARRESMDRQRALEAEQKKQQQAASFSRYMTLGSRMIRGYGDTIVVYRRSDSLQS
jgi:hypothetical protein